MDRRGFLAMAIAAAATAGVADAQTAAAAGGALGAVRAITIAAPDPELIAKAYADFLGYQVVWRGTVSAATARSWDAPATAGRRVVVMAPSSGEPTVFRFVEQPLPAAYRPLTTYGWNAAEILVQDPDALAARLKASPFRIIGPPRGLPGFPAKAMQVVGPAQEVLYFTHFEADPANPGSRRQPKAFVDYCFIAVAGGADMEAGLAYYTRTFGNKANPPFEIVNPIISDANHMPAETKHRLSTVPLANGRMIEMDQFPSVTTARAKPKGGLPPGISLVTFDYTGPDRPELAWVAPGAQSAMPPVARHATATLVGAVRERIELLRA